MSHSQNTTTKLSPEAQIIRPLLESMKCKTVVLCLMAVDVIVKVTLTELLQCLKYRILVIEENDKTDFRSKRSFKEASYI